MAVASRMSLEEFLALPDEKPYLEYACGKVVPKPLPTWNHSAIQGFLLHVLMRFLEANRLGRVMPELRFIFGPPGDRRAYVPDVSFVSAEHFPDGPYPDVAPDLAIEVRSPRQNVAWLLDKAGFCLANGSRLVWVIDTGARSIAVLAPRKESQTLGAGDTLDGGEVLPGLTVAVDEILAQADR
jgi:Uma2 family endonuclease